MSEPLVEMIEVVKRYGKIRALEGVTLTVGRGEIVALVGDNGAGKSTLIKVLSGVDSPTAGEIHFDGSPVRFRSTADAIDAGIETIYQDSSLVEQLTIGRNLFLGREPRRRLGPIEVLDKKTMDSVSQQLLERVGITKELDPRTPVSSLSGGERQSIAIARAMYFDSELIILDEPTNNLGLEETRGVMDFVQETKRSGHSTIFITHNMHHVFEVADRIVVLRLGKKVGDLIASETTLEEVTALITGVQE